MAVGTLRRDLGLTEAVTIVVGSMIGSGIFLGVDTAAGLLPSGPLLVVVFLVSGLLVLMGALTYGELAAMVPESGGHYAYMREGYGRLAAFLQGWNIFTIAKSASVAALAVGFTEYLGFLLPLSTGAGKLIAVSLIALLTVVNIVGVRYAGWLSNLSTFAKVGALVVLVVGGALVLGGATPQAPARAPPAGLGLITAFGAAMVFAMFAYDGWANSTQVAEEVRDPQRNVPRSLVVGVVVVMAVYVAVVLVYVLVLGAGGLAATARPAPEVARAFAGDAGAVFVLVAVLVSIFGTMNAVILSGPRIYYAMARDGLFPKRIAEVHPRFGTPVWSIAAQGAWSAVLALSGTFEQLLTTIIFMSWIFYGAAALVVIRWRRERPDAARPYRVPGYPVVPVVFVAASALFTVNTLVTQPVESLAGVAILASGLPIYLWYSRKPEEPIPVVDPASGRPPSADSRELVDEAILERYVARLSDEGRGWSGEAAARDLRMRPDEIYAAVARLAARGRVSVAYADGSLRVVPRAAAR